MPGWQMTGDDRDVLRDTTVGDRNTGIRGGRERRGHPRDDRAPHPRQPACLRLLAATAEQERIPALEPDDRAARERLFDQQAVDVLLAAGERAGTLAAVDDLRFRPGIPEHIGGHQAVGDDHVGRGKQFPATNGEQPRIAGPRPDQPDLPRAPRRDVPRGLPRALTLVHPCDATAHAHAAPAVEPDRTRR